MGRKAFSPVTLARLDAFKEREGRGARPYVIGPAEAALAALGMLPFPNVVRLAAEGVLARSTKPGALACLECGKMQPRVGWIIVAVPENAAPDEVIAGVCCLHCAPDRASAERIKVAMMAELGYEMTHEAPEMLQ